MTHKLPHTITNCIGETLTFKSYDPETDKLIVENFCKPGAGPPMHTHFKQDECLTVVSGKIGYQIQGQEEKFAGPGQTVLFKQGVPHRFWAAGTEVLHCKGWIKPANSIVYFLSAIYAAQNKSGSGKPESFDGAYLMSRYASEYDMPEIPSFVKKVVFPVQVFVGKMLGKYRHFKDSPTPL
jgi:mannose-6-phosphate isomerase-like protein (cupin superfamily)